MDVWWFVRVTLATVDLDTVDAVLVYGLGMPLTSHKLQDIVTYMSRTNDCPYPVAHRDIFAIREAIRTRAISDSLLTLLELLEKPEASWY